MSNKNYCKRVWLNPNGSAATGSVVAFCGKTAYVKKNGEPYDDMYLEIADCLGKVRLHKAALEDKQIYIYKLRKLEKVIHDYANHIEQDI